MHLLFLSLKVFSYRWLVRDLWWLLSVTKCPKNMKKSQHHSSSVLNENIDYNKSKLWIQRFLCQRSFAVSCNNMPKTHKEVRHIYLCCFHGIDWIDNNKLVEFCWKVSSWNLFMRERIEIISAITCRQMVSVTIFQYCKTAR